MKYSAMSPDCSSRLYLLLWCRNGGRRWCRGNSEFIRPSWYVRCSGSCRHRRALLQSGNHYFIPSLLDKGNISSRTVRGWRWTLLYGPGASPNWHAAPLKLCPAPPVSDTPHQREAWPGGAKPKVAQLCTLLTRQSTQLTYSTSGRDSIATTTNMVTWYTQ